MAVPYSQHSYSSIFRDIGKHYLGSEHCQHRRREEFEVLERVKKSLACYREIYQAIEFLGQWIYIF